MKKRSICTLFSLLLALLMVLSLRMEVNAEGGVFDFPLPEGMWIPEESVTEKDCPIICPGARIGGFILTDLEPMVLLPGSEEQICQYLSQYVPEGLTFDYMMGWGPGDVADVSFILVDPDAMRFREIRHSFFLRGDKVYDLWLDTRYADDRMQYDILTTVGVLDDSILFVSEPKDYDFDFGVPEGFTLGTPEGDSCPIFWDGVVVGGFRGTELTERMLQEDDGTLNINDYLPEDKITYAEDSAAEFAVTRFLSQGLPETTGYEYILMYAEDSSGGPAVSVSWKETDYETGDVKESSHTLFRKNGITYDLWLDYSILDRDRHYGFLAAAGIE